MSKCLNCGKLLKECDVLDEALKEALGLIAYFHFHDGALSSRIRIDQAEAFLKKHQAT